MAIAMSRVFVYGTLKRGHPNHYLLSDTTNKYGVAKFIGAAKLVNKYPLVVYCHYNIPFLLPSQGKGENVHGEVYEVDSKMLATLDELEDHPNLYIRTPVTCVLDQGSTEGETLNVEAYMLHSFNPSMLLEPYLSEYTLELTKTRPYSSRAYRVEDYNIFDEVKEQKE